MAKGNDKILFFLREFKEDMRQALNEINTKLDELTEWKGEISAVVAEHTTQIKHLQKRVNKFTSVISSAFGILATGVGLVLKFFFHK